MPHIGLICPAFSGHLNPMTSLGRELCRRGHRATLIAVRDAEPKAQAAGLSFQALGEAEFPRGHVAEFSAALGRLGGISAVRMTIGHYVRSGRVVLRDAPRVLRDAGIDLLLVDQTDTAAATVAEALRIPFVTVCNALLMNEEPSVPPMVTRWRFKTTWAARQRNRFGYFLFHKASRPIHSLVNRQRRLWKLPPQRTFDGVFSNLAQIGQLPAEFDFPREDLPACFHYTGPLSDPAAREPVAFPYDRLTGRPLVYASMGTLQNRQAEVFRCIAAACAGLDVQLVISLGGADLSMAAGLPGSPLVVHYAPQLDLLNRAALTITHAGLNTVMESLQNGTPLVAIPITNDQPGVAARLAWTGAGRIVSRSKLTVSRLRSAIERVLGEDSFRWNAARLQAAIARAGGVRRAADVVEQTVAIDGPALSNPLRAAA